MLLFVRLHYNKFRGILNTLLLFTDLSAENLVLHGITAGQYNSVVFL